MDKGRAVNIAVACVMASELGSEEKREVIRNLRKIERVADDKGKARISYNGEVATRPVVSPPKKEDIIGRMSNKRLIDEYKKCITDVGIGVYGENKYKLTESVPRLRLLEEEVRARMAEIMDFE